LFRTGRLVVPDVYNMQPPRPEGWASTATLFFAVAPCSILSVMMSTGCCCSPAFRTSSAFFLKVGVERSSLASLFSRRYRSSLVGNKGERGSAIASRARMARNVTTTPLLKFKRQGCAAYRHNRSCFPQEMLLAPLPKVSHQQTLRYGPSLPRHLGANYHKRMVARCCYGLLL
jgi:hypothetical protein